MSRGTRVAFLLAAVLVIAVAGSVFATRQAPPSEQPAQLTQDGEDAPPTADELAHAADRLTEAGVPFTDDQLNDLAGRYGLGGAVRVLAWSNGDANVQNQITAWRDGDGSEGSVMGWGQIAKELNVHPGIGSIMGNGGGHGRDNAPGQNRDEGEESDG